MIIALTIGLFLSVAYSAFLTVLFIGQAHLLQKLEKDQRTMFNFISDLITPGRFSVAYVPKKDAPSKPPARSN